MAQRLKRYPVFVSFRFEYPLLYLKDNDFFKALLWPEKHLLCSTRCDLPTLNVANRLAKPKLIGSYELLDRTLKYFVSWIICTLNKPYL